MRRKQRKTEQQIQREADVDSEDVTEEGKESLAVMNCSNRHGKASFDVHQPFASEFVKLVDSFYAWPKSDNS
jgi:hypothetical protein